VSLFGIGSSKAWGDLGQALGLRPFTVTTPYRRGSGFRRLVRSLGLPVTWEADSSHAFHGRYHECEVVLLQYEVESVDASDTRTAVIARVDPPLFLGLTVEKREFLDGVVGGIEVSVGDVEVHRKLHIQGFERELITELFSSRDPICMRVITHLAALSSPMNPYVGDSLVELAKEGVHTNVDEVRGMLDAATDLAIWLAQRRGQLPPSPTQEVQREAWQRYAAEHGYALDRARMKLSGERELTAWEIALEPEQQSVLTAATARFATPAPVAFCATRSSVVGLVQGMFSQDIVVGDAGFDERYQVTGQPEAAVRELLLRPGLLTLLKHLGSVTREVQLNHQGLYFRVPGSCPQPEHVESLVQTVCRANHALVGAVAGLEAYR